MKNTKKSNVIYPFFVLSMICISAMLCTSCSKPAGCIDPQSENYDPAAEEDDGSCSYIRDKFIGNYTGTFEIRFGRIANGTVAIKKHPNVKNKIEITFSSPQTNLTTGEGTVTGNVISWSYENAFENAGFECNQPNLEGSWVGSGKCIFSEDSQSFTITSANWNFTSGGSSVCSYTWSGEFSRL